MQSALPYPTGQTRQLVPFVLLALLLHLALLFALHLPMNTPSVTRPHPLIVSFVSTPAAERNLIANKAPSVKRANPSRLLIAPDTTTAQLAVQQNTSPSLGTFIDTSPLQLQESARSIARDEARLSEQHHAAQEQKKLTTPSVSLEQYLKQPHKEIRLANGMLKIITGAGDVCFQAVPPFAHDSLGVFGIPTSCP